MKKFWKFMISAILIVSLLLPLGACNDSRLDTPQLSGIDDNLRLSWSPVQMARSYQLEISAVGGETTEETSQRSSFDLATLEEGDYTIRLRAVGGKNNDVFSDWSKTVDFHRDKESGLLYRLINGNTEYEVRSAGSASGDIVIDGVYRGKPVTGIGITAFRSSAKLTSVVIPDSVTYIADSAFYNCANLTSVTIPESVTRIGTSAFQQCTKLADVKIPDAVTKIERLTFGYCRALEKIELSDNIVEIDESAFANCTGITEITIPDSVTTIGRTVFRDMTGLRSVTLGSGITSLGSGAFMGCTALTDVTFHPLEGELIFPVQAFANCTALTSIRLPDGVTAVDSYCFTGCSALEEIELPDTVTELAQGAFYGSKIFDDQNNSEGGDGLIYVGNWLVDAKEDFKKEVNVIGGSQSDLNDLMNGEKGVVIRPGTVGIGNAAFIYIWIIQVQTLDKEGKPVFDEEGNPVMHDEPEYVSCENLRALTLPAGLKYIGSQAFYHSPKLYRFYAQNDSDLLTVGNYAFARSESLQIVVFTEGLREIGTRAFSDCTILEQLSDPKYLTPDSLTRMGESAFAHTAISAAAPGNVYYVGNWLAGYDTESEQPISGTVELQEGTVGIADFALYAAQNITGVTNMTGVTKIGRGAFAYCSQLGAISLSQSVREIKEFTFYMCQELERITLPMRLGNVGYAAFYRCERLGSIDFSHTQVSALEDFAFDGCINLSTITFGEDLTSIGKYAFAGCRLLRTVEIPDTVTSLGKRAFGDCVSLDTVKIGSGISELPDYAFAGCVWLREITIPSTVKSVGNYAFYNCERLLHLNIEEGVETIGDYAFRGNAMLTHVELPASVRSVGVRAFKDCTMLEGLTFRGTPETVDENAFFGCTALTIYGTGAEGDWDSLWNSSQRPAVWDVTLSDEGYVESVTVGEIEHSHVYNGFSGPGREGYDFVGWATEKGGEAVYTAADLGEIPAGTTLYTVWKEAEPDDLAAREDEYFFWILKYMLSQDGGDNEYGDLDTMTPDELKDLFDDLFYDKIQDDGSETDPGQEGTAP